MTMDPAAWPHDEVDEYMRRSVELRDLESRSAEGSRAVVVGSTGPFAQLAGRMALQSGGSSVDAAMTTALTQIALAAGAWVSYAGIMSVIHYDAASGQVSSLNAGYRSFREEQDPRSIPRAPEPSGRTALVPGFFAGVRAAHVRFGRLAWDALFAPAIWVADTGFLLGPTRAAHFDMRRDVLARTPEPLEAFGGSVPVEGDTVRQPALARTLRRVAAEGTDHLYRGEWAQRFVDVVRREGGRAVLDDLRDYRVAWGPPLSTTFDGYEVAAVGEPDVGGAALLEGLNLVELAGITDPRASADDLFWMIQVSRQAHVFGAMGNTAGPVGPAERATKEHARRTWELMQRAGRFVGPGAYVSGSHSDFVAVADEDGNVTALTHTINTGMWGTTGLFVDGFSIPDSAAFQQAALAAIPAGAQLPNPMNPAIVLRNGAPVLASTSIGSGLPETTLQCLVAVLRGGADPAAAAAMPKYHGPAFIEGDSINTEVRRTETPRLGDQYADAANRASARFTALLEGSAQSIEDGFDAGVLAAARERGVELSVRPTTDGTLPRGYWGAIAIDRVTGRLQGARTNFCNGSVEAW